MHKLALLILVATVLLYYIGFVNASSMMVSKSTLAHKWIDRRLRGGARPKGEAQISKSKHSANKRTSRDDDEDSYEDDEDDEEDYRNIRAKKGNKNQSNMRQRSPSSSRSNTKNKRPISNKKPAAKSIKFQLIPWGSSSSNKKDNKNKKNSKNKKGGGGVGAFANSLNIKENLQNFAKTGQAVYKNVYRNVKVLRSSQFEGTLLKATWPGNDPVPPELLREIIKYGIPSYKHARKEENEEDPYYMTLHKLWTKMCEKDWRTVIKSLFILHTISRDCSKEDCKEFASAMKEQSQVINEKDKQGYPYFDTRRLIVNLDANSVPYEPFVHSYGSYVIQRAKTFSTSSFDEVGQQLKINKTNEKKVYTALKKVQTLIKTGLDCLAALENKSEKNVITGQAIRLIVEDMKVVWRLYKEKIAPFVVVDGSSDEGNGSANTTASSSYSEPRISKEEISQLLSFYEEYDGKITEFIQDAAKAFAKLRIKISADDSSSSNEGGGGVSAEKVHARLEELMKVKGGFMAATADKGKRRIQPEEEEEEEAEGEEEEYDGEEGEDEDGETEDEDSEDAAEDEEGEKEEEEEVNDKDDDADDKGEEEDDEELATAEKEFAKQESKVEGIKKGLPKSSHSNDEEEEEEEEEETDGDDKDEDEDGKEDAEAADDDDEEGEEEEEGEEDEEEENNEEEEEEEDDQQEDEGNDEDNDGEDEEE